MTKPEVPANRWLITATIMIGTLASVLASSTINVALTDIMNGLQTDLNTIDWIITGFMLATVIAMPCTGWLGDVLGRRNLYALGLMIFMAGSVLAGAAWSIESLIVFRLLQGLGGGLMMPTAQAILFETFPPDQRGLAMGIYGLGAILGPAFGPTVGGYLVELLGWRSLFYINLPFAALSLAMLLIFTPTRPAATARRFDAWGFAWLVVMLGCLQLALGSGNREGWDSPYIVGLFTGAALGFSAFLWQELTTDDPLVDLSVFTNGGYCLGTIVSTALGLGLYGSTFLLPLFLGSVKGYTSLQIGELMVVGSLVMGVAMLISGRLSDWIDPRLLVGGGLATFAFSLFQQASIGLDTPDAVFIWALVWRGVGMGLVFAPLAAVTLNALDHRQIGGGSGLFNLTRQLGGTVGIAILKSLLQTRTVFHIDTLSQAMANSTPARSAIALLAERALHLGAAPAMARLQGSAMVVALARRQGTVLGFDDVFWVAMVLIGGCIVPALLLRPSSRLKA